MSKADAPEAAAAAEPLPVPDGVSIANHPRASAWIQRRRAQVAIAAFAVVLLYALHGDVPAADAVVRALIAGVCGFLAAWAIGLALWRQIVMAELRAAYERRAARRAQLLQLARERAQADREAAEARAAARRDTAPAT